MFLPNNEKGPSEHEKKRRYELIVFITKSTAVLFTNTHLLFVVSVTNAGRWDLISLRLLIVNPYRHLM